MTQNSSYSYGCIDIALSSDDEFNEGLDRLQRTIGFLHAKSGYCLEEISALFDRDSVLQVYWDCPVNDFMISDWKPADDEKKAVEDAWRYSLGPRELGVKVEHYISSKSWKRLS